MGLEFRLFPRSESPGYLICQAATSLKTGLNRAFQANGLNVTPEQWTVLSSLWENDDVHQSLLAEKTAKDRHNITRILNLLEKSGLVRREPDCNDRRLRKVYLTEEGKALRPDLVRIAEDFLRQSLTGLRQKDLDFMTKIMRLIINNVSGACENVEASRSSQTGSRIPEAGRRTIPRRSRDAWRDNKS
jgi:MarR family transcriptional regulator, organic hydroperoxide resistance regulator